MIPIAIGAVALCVVGFFLFQILTTTHVTVNGQELKMRAGDKIQKLLDDEVVKPNPGRLLAVDKSVIDETGGEVCTATINGEAASVDSEIPNNATITIEDGGDTTEEADEKEEAIPHGTADDDRSFNNYFNGSLHLLTDGEDGTKVVRTGKVSGKTVEEVTKPAVDSGYQVYTAKPSDKVIALTFDDGPWPETTSQILDILEENNAKATFFTIGNQIADHADDVKRAHEMGCQICTHSWDHADGSGQGVNLCYMSASEQREEIEKGMQAIEDAIGEKTDPIMRAPGGNFYDDIIDNVWDLLDAEIGWDLDTEDWSRPGSDAIEQVILSAQPGQVILMHDGGGEREQTVEALKSALPKLAADGYSFITINEMLAYGVPGASGTTSSDGTASEGLERTTGSSDSTATDASDDTTASDDAANEETSSDETAAA